MEKEIKCSGKELIYMVCSLYDENFFEKLLEEPSRESLTEESRAYFPNESENAYEDLYSSMIRSYHSEHKTATELYKYGNTKEEIIKNLGKHVKRCCECSKVYLSALLDPICGAVNFKNSKNPTLSGIGKRVLGENFEDKGIFKVLKERDKRILRLLED